MGGNLLAGALVSLWGMNVIAPWLAISIVFNLLSIRALPPPGARQTRSDLGLRMRATLAEARELMASRAFVIFLIAASLDQGSHAFYYSYGGLHWRQLGYSGALIGIIWPLGILAEIALMSFSLRVFRALGATRLLLLGGTGCLLRWTILAFDPPLGLRDLRAIPAWRDVRDGASGRDVFHPQIRAAAIGRDRAEPLCGVFVRHCDGTGDARERPALCRLRRTRLSV